MGGYSPPPFGGPADELATSGAAINIGSASPPTVGEVLTAIDATHADWEPGGGGAADDLATSGADVNVSAAPPPSPGQVLTATDATHANWQSPGSGGLLHVAQIELTGADLAAINTTPVTAVAAPGAGKAILVLSPGAANALGLLIQSKVGTTPYTLLGTLSILGLYQNLANGNEWASSSNISGILGTDLISTNAFLAVQFADSKAAFENRALILQADSASTGKITASTLNDGGLGYAVNDTFTVDDGDGNAAGVVDTVGALGVVLTYHLTDGGKTYGLDDHTTTATSGVGTGLIITTTAVQSVDDGDGSLYLTIPYILVDVN